MNQLKQAADMLDSASKDLQDFRQAMVAIPIEEVTGAIMDMAITRTIHVLSRLIESVGLLGEHVSLLTGSVTSAGAVLLGQPIMHQCPECGLPIGSNASSSDDDNNPCGCQTCTAVVQQHRNTVGNKCPECGCLIGTNEENCRRCLDEAYFQRQDSYHVSQRPTKHA